MLSPNLTIFKLESRKTKLGRSLREFFSKKRASHALISSSSQSLHSSVAGSIQKGVQKPLITVEDTLSVVEFEDAGISTGPHHAPQSTTQSSQSLISRKSKTSSIPTQVTPHNEKQWRMAYEIAMESLTVDEKAQVNSDMISSCTIHLVLDAASRACAERDESKWRYTKSNGEVVVLRERFDKIIEGFTKCADCISISNRNQPEVTSLVWSTVRSLIQIYLNHKESINMLEASLKTLAISMANCGFYASIFEDALSRQFASPEMSGTWEKQLERALPEYYAAILVFSIKAKGYFMSSNKGRLNSLFTPLHAAPQPHLTAIENKEKKLRELASMATMEGVKDLRAKMETVGKMKELFAQVSDKEALNWLSAVSPDAQYDFHKDRRLDGTCEWIFRTQKYQNWIDGTGNRDLWVVGIPGAGKSVLTTSLVDELRSKTDILALYFFFRDGDMLTTSPLEMVASLIAQLINSGVDKERLMRILKLRVQSSSYYTSKGTEPRDLGKLCAMFLEMLQGFPIPVTILLDAMDECTDPSKVVRHLLQPAKNPSSIAHMMLLPNLGKEMRAQFLLTGRPNVHDIFASLPYISTIDMDVNEDIRRFVSEKIADNESLRRHESQIMATIYENSQGMFRYAALVLEELNEYSPEPISKRLQTMPKGVTGMYELILSRLGSKGGVWEHKMRQTLLLWVTLAYRPVKLGEMQYACATIEGDKSFNPDAVVLPTRKQMLAACGPLLEVTGSNEFRFTHRTVKEFLLQPLDGLSETARNDEKVTSCMVNEAEGHARMTMTCVTQLFSNGLNQLATKLNHNEKSFRTFVSGMNRNGDQRGIPLSESPFHYAVSYWINHAMKVPHGARRLSISKELWELVRDFFWDQDSMVFIEWLRIFEYKGKEWHGVPIQSKRSRGSSGQSVRCLHESQKKSAIGGCIHVAVSYGLVDILAWAHPHGLVFDTRDGNGLTPLMWAATVGEEDAVKVLLTNSGVDINRTTCIKDCDRTCRGYPRPTPKV